METIKEEVQTFEEAVLKTVMFWSEKGFRTKFNQNNGDDSANGGMAFILMNMLAGKAQESVTEEKIKKFEDSLSKKLHEAKANGSRWELTLDVDYDPNKMLYEACQEAGLDPRALPCKTFTRINEDNSVDAKYQYGGKFVKL